MEFQSTCSLFLNTSDTCGQCDDSVVDDDDDDDDDDNVNGNDGNVLLVCQANKSKHHAGENIPGNTAVHRHRKSQCGVASGVVV